VQGMSIRLSLIMPISVDSVVPSNCAASNVLMMSFSSIELFIEASFKLLNPACTLYEALSMLLEIIFALITKAMENIIKETDKNMFLCKLTPPLYFTSCGIT
jgi:hypothetical protein